jgi:RND family efflux transporter MFP subunit
MIIFRSLTFYLALIGITLAIILITKSNTPAPEPIYFEPAINPFETTIAAAGLIEAVDKNIEIGVPQSALVKEVYVKVGNKVQAGQILFRLDDRDLLAQLLVQKAQVIVSMAHLQRLQDQLSRLELIEDPRAISREELNTRRSDVAVAKAQVEAAEAQVTHTILMLERLCICAPQNGVILQNNIRKGEFIAAGGLAAIILGDLERLQVRAEIDEQNASRIFPYTTAFAFPKNNSQLRIPLYFERIEPYVIPKRSLTGASDEKTDTRVLQVIYSFDHPLSFPLYVGQQVDIFIESPENGSIAQVKESSSDAV